MAPSSSGLGHLVLIQEIMSSNLIGVTNYKFGNLIQSDLLTNGEGGVMINTLVINI
jgi:hypothetical protein